MKLSDNPKFLVDQIQKKSDLLQHNRTLFDIYEGDLMTYVLQDLAQQLSLNSFNQIKHRVVPINVLKRVIEKLSKIYAKSPEREYMPEDDRTKAFLQFYWDSMQPDTVMGMSNEFFNLFKNTCVEPYLDRGFPKLRTIPSDRFLVYSDDPVDPMRVTHWIKSMGKYGDKKIFYQYSDEEFLITDENGNIMRELMFNAGNPEGINIYGAIPMVYINKSRHELIPPIDTDTLAMTKIFPVLMSDLNYAIMFQSFSTIYAIDADMTNMVQAPNAIWNIKSDAQSDKTPQIGTIKPSVDITEVMGYIQMQLAFWLNTRNIRPGTIGALTKDNFASGISKMVDEMDTSEDRQKQVQYFKEAEIKLWDLVFNFMHPVWEREPDWMGPRGLSPVKSVTVCFEDQTAIQDSSKVLDDTIKALNAGLITKIDAVKAVNPEIPEDEIDSYMTELENENSVEVPNGGQEIYPAGDSNTPPVQA